MKKHMTAFTVALTLLVASALAAGEVDIRTWTLDEAARAGWSVKTLIGAKAFGPNRMQIGNVETPPTAESVSKYGLFDGMPNQVAIGSGEWRATEFIGDYVNLHGGNHYGHVRDLILSKRDNSRRLSSVPALAGVNMGTTTITYPFYGYGDAATGGRRR